MFAYMFEEQWTKISKKLIKLGPQNPKNVQTYPAHEWSSKKKSALLSLKNSPNAHQASYNINKPTPALKHRPEAVTDKIRRLILLRINSK